MKIGVKRVVVMSRFLASPQLKPNSMSNAIAGTDVAAFLLTAISQPTSVRQGVVITTQ